MSCSHTVLVVEDDSDIRDLIADLLRDDGYQVETAENGQDALAILERTTPCVVLLDMMMPVMSGGELLRRLDRDGRLPKLPVVVVSALEMRDTPFGARRYLRKPPSFEQLLDTVREYCAA